jgi:hypothetical protein
VSSLQQMIPAGMNELRSAFVQHKQNAGGMTSCSHNLVQFYAIECGIKWVYLRRNKINTTARIQNDLLKATHDLWLFGKELKLPAATLGPVGACFRLGRDRDSRWHYREAHQAWRYGVRIFGSDERALLEWLNRLQKWIEEN